MHQFSPGIRKLFPKFRAQRFHNSIADRKDTSLMMKKGFLATILIVLVSIPAHGQASIPKCNAKVSYPENGYALRPQLSAKHARLSIMANIPDGSWIDQGIRLSDRALNDDIAATVFLVYEYDPKTDNVRNTRFVANLNSLTRSDGSTIESVDMTGRIRLNGQDIPGIPYYRKGSLVEFGKTDYPPDFAEQIIQEKQPFEFWVCDRADQTQCLYADVKANFGDAAISNAEAVLRDRYADRRDGACS